MRKIATRKLYSHVHAINLKVNQSVSFTDEQWENLSPAVKSCFKDQPQASKVTAKSTAKPKASTKEPEVKS